MLQSYLWKCVLVFASLCTVVMIMGNCGWIKEALLCTVTRNGVFLFLSIRLSVCVCVSSTVLDRDNNNEISSSKEMALHDALESVFLCVCSTLFQSSNQFASCQGGLFTKTFIKSSHIIPSLHPECMCSRHQTGWLFLCTRASCVYNLWVCVAFKLDV